MSRTAFELNNREYAALRAVAAGRAEMTRSCEPDLFVDGMCFCDQTVAHGLFHAGLLSAANAVRIGGRVRAVLTDTGRSALAYDHRRDVQEARLST